MGRGDSRWAVLAGVLSLAVATSSPFDGHSRAEAAPDAGANKGAASGDVLLGEWWTDNNEGRIRFTKDADGTFRGTTTCCIPKLETADHPARDYHNPDPKLKNRSTVGIVLIWKLAYQDGAYSNGNVYNPRNGKVYGFLAKIIDKNTIKIRGYLGIPLLGWSQTWKRVRPGEVTDTTRLGSAR